MFNREKFIDELTRLITLVGTSDDPQIKIAGAALVPIKAQLQLDATAVIGTVRANVNAALDTLSSLSGMFGRQDDKTVT